MNRLGSALVTRTYPANGSALTFRPDGWFNMTQAAQQFGKRLDNFWTSPDTKEYLGEIGKHPEFQGVSTIRTVPGRTGGTWAHPKLAVFFARWLDVKFSVWCDMQIDKLLRGEVPQALREESQIVILGVHPGAYSP